MARDRKWENIFRRIDRAIARGLKSGVCLVQGRFGSYKPGRGCCALSMAVADDTVDNVVTAAIKKLGITESEAWGIVYGFDDNKVGTRMGQPGFNVGEKLRLKYKPERLT